MMVGQTAKAAVLVLLFVSSTLAQLPIGSRTPTETLVRTPEERTALALAGAIAEAKVEKNVPCYKPNCKPTS